MQEDEQPRPFKARDSVDPLMSIGVFARRSRLSMKALRLYERLEILIPAQVEQGNGYRRYRESQLATARLIVMQRRLDMPLARVAEVVAADGPQGAALVAAYWEEIEHRIPSQRQLAAHLRNRLLGKEGDFSMYKIHQRAVPEQLVLTEQRHIQVDDLPGWIAEATMRMEKAAAGQGGVTGPMFVVYHGDVNQESDGPVEVCLPISLMQAGASDTATRREPAHREAYVRITKAQVAFPQILSAYDAVGQWLSANELSAAGPPREIYFADWGAAGPTDEVCDIAFPMP